ncbi:hypothetical protein BP6252_11708 [Coleophoma cylindrospora]|uniref:SRR1-like domain-containing protein n=1 Tax=Coleophoma cylindrospora TaxID=1849047 RepID=A0A3D8QKE4_9HELO|nr:hypothetical protein BP6252_11708 [Coleophoma cylindrospora]
MPHTNRKKKSSTGAPAPKVIHTKRQEVEDADGWTHVVEGRRHTSRASAAKAKAQEPWLQAGDFMENGIAYVTKTLEELGADQEYYARLWRESEAAGQLRRQFEGRKLQVDRVVVLGLGSLQLARREGRRASHTQLAALRSVMDIIDPTSSIEYYLQDPHFSALDKEYFNSLGYKVLEDPAAFSHITSSTLVYAIHCYAKVYAEINKGPKPAILVATDTKNFGIHTPADVVKEIEDLVEECEQTEFPQLRHDFSDTLIYWRGDCKKVVVEEKASEAVSDNVLENTAEPKSAQAVEPNAESNTGADAESKPETAASEPTAASEETPQS